MHIFTTYSTGPADSSAAYKAALVYYAGDAWLILCFAPSNISPHHVITCLIIIIWCNISITLKTNNCINKLKTEKQ